MAAIQSQCYEKSEERKKGDAEQLEQVLGLGFWHGRVQSTNHKECPGNLEIITLQMIDKI
jgi:hypothetical protein